MKIIVILACFYLFSCGYPDIDTVPTFENLKLTEDELFDLCELLTADKKQIANCIKERQNF